MKKPICIFTSDWHIWGNPTLFRNAEEDWFSVMARPLRQIRRYQKLNGYIPVFVPGDIFDFYNARSEVVNWLIKQMPKNVWAIPGQHDLQNHNYDLLEKTSFWTLVEAQVLNFADPEQDWLLQPTMEGKTVIQLVTKPWKYTREAPVRSSLADLTIYMAHQYIYAGRDTCYGEVDKSCHISNSKDFLKDVDVAVFGDNHIPFISKIGKTKVVNCGTMIRRKVDERSYETGFVVLYDDFSLEKIPFDTSKDQFSKITITKQDEEKHEKLAAELLDELRASGNESVDFQQELERYMESKSFSKKSKKIMTEIFTKYRENKDE